MMLRKVTTPKAVAALSLALDVPEASIRVCARQMRENAAELLPNGLRGRGAPGLEPFHVARLIIALLVDQKNPHDAPRNAAIFSALSLVKAEEMRPDTTEAQKAFFLSLALENSERADTALGKIITAFALQTSELRSVCEEAAIGAPEGGGIVMVHDDGKFQVQPSRPALIFELFGVRMKFGLPSDSTLSAFEAFKPFRTTIRQSPWIPLEPILTVAALYAPGNGDSEQ